MKEEYDKEKKYVKKTFKDKLSDVDKAYDKNINGWKQSILEMRLAIDNVTRKAVQEAEAEKASEEATVVEQLKE